MSVFCFDLDFFSVFRKSCFKNYLCLTAEIEMHLRYDI